jgi:hypothetical protein
MPPVIRIVAHNITAIDNVTSIRLIESFNSPVAQAIIEGDGTSLSLGDSFSFRIGYLGNTDKVFEGFVRDITQNTLERTVTITFEDVLAKALDYFIASDDPENPLSFENVSTETLVVGILAEADISGINANLPLSVTWGTNGPIEINLIMAWAAAKSIVDMMAWHIYADRNGDIQLLDRKPYVMAGDSSSYSWTVGTDNVTAIDYTKSTENLRNRVVVYGKDNISADASAVSPYLPAGFYKTAVIATPYLDTVGKCQLAADFNLALFNRLTERLTLSIEGDHQIVARDVATVTDAYTGVSGDWFI